MVVLAERRSSRSALWAARLSTFSAVLFVVAGLGHRLGLVETTGFFWVLGSVAALALAALVLATAGFFQLWTYGARGGRALRARSSSALLVLSPFLVSAWRVYAFPMLSDISTDVTDPPPLDAAALAAHRRHEPGGADLGGRMRPCRRMPIRTSPEGAIRSRPTASRNSRQRW